MKEFKYKPKSVEGLEGYVVLNMLNHFERLDLLKQIDPDSGEKKDKWDSAKKNFELVEKQVKEVSLSYGNNEFKSVEDLSYFEEGISVINEIAGVIGGGIKLGKLPAKP